MPDMGKSAHRMSALQKKIFIVLATFAEHQDGPVATRDIERSIVSEGDKPVYGANLRGACRLLETRGLLRTLRAKNLQLQVELTATGLKYARALLQATRQEKQKEEQAKYSKVLPVSSVREVVRNINLEINGALQTTCSADFVIRYDGTSCLQLWQMDGNLVRLEGDVLTIAGWYQDCHDAGLPVQVQINESQASLMAVGQDTAIRTEYEPACR